ncbi:MAG: hypothetical protein AAFQ80_06575 [Cyanobacteria bacterium J06621_8]
MIIPSSDNVLIASLPQDIFLLEDQITLDENGEIIDNNLPFAQPLIKNDISESISYNSAGDIIEISGVASDGLDFVGGFGDYDGGNDLTLEVKDSRENVIETFSMTGAGQGTLYKDDEKEYIFFSDTNETTKVDIDAVSDLVFEDYIGDSLSIETTGSIEGGNITLNDENLEEDSGLTLRAGIDTENSVSNVFDGYTLVDFNTHREMVDINYYGQIVGNDTFSGSETFFFYDGQRLNYLPGYESSRAFGINDFVQMIGEGVSSTSDDPHIPFLVFGDGTVEEFTYGEGGAGRPSPNSSGADVVYTYDPLAHPRDINNFVEVASYQLNTLPENAPPELQPRSFEDANFQSPGGAASVNIGYEFLKSDDSRAFGINDLGQVVGINRETNRAFIFNRADDPDDHSITNLGTLPGDDYSAAYAINDVGQVVGVSTGASGSRAFIYENRTMKDLGISYTGDPEKRDGIDINNLGQAVVTSAAGEPFVYQDGVVTNINDWLRPEVTDLGYTVTEAKGINDRGQIIAQGTLAGSDRGLLLNPTFKLVNRNINVGNISTFGETVVLEGAEVYLEGESVTTQGGIIESNGKTIVNRNLVIDSSITDDSVGNPDAESIDSVDSESEVTIAGGDITFSDTLNSNSAGEQSLTIKAGAGELEFAGEIGDESPLFDLMVEGAGKLTADGDLTVGNELHLEVINEITMANITAAGLANISLGKVGEDIFASSGNVTLENVEALSLEVANNGSFTAGDLTTSDGGINVVSLNNISAKKLISTNGAINLISAMGGISIENTVEGDLGITALASQNINTKELISAQNFVILKSNNGGITVNGSIMAYGDISLASPNNVSIKDASSSNGGVALISTSGSTVYDGLISSMEDVTVASAQDLVINRRIKTDLGRISLISQKGSVKTQIVLNSGFNVEVVANSNIDILGINSSGNVDLKSISGRVNIMGNIKSGGGDITISGLKRVNSGNIISKGGDISIISNQNSIKTGYIRADSENGGGDLYLEALKFIKVTNRINLEGNDYSIYAGEESIITIIQQQTRGKIIGDKNFVIGDISLSGTEADIRGQYAFIPSPNPQPNPIAPFIDFIFRAIKEAFESSPTPEPTHVIDINPVTAKPYVDDLERQLNEQLTEAQKKRLNELLHKKTRRGELIFKDEEYRKGKVDDRTGCFTSELNQHLGDTPRYPYPGLYATYVTGSIGDYLVVASNSAANYAFYDGLVKPNGAVTNPLRTGGEFIENPGSVAEVKIQHDWLTKFIRTNHPEYNNERKTPDEIRKFNNLIKQLNRESSVAELCGLRFFVSFESGIAALGGKEIFENFRPKPAGLNRQVSVHHLPQPGLYDIRI